MLYSTIVHSSALRQLNILCAAPSQASCHSVDTMRRPSSNCRSAEPPAAGTVALTHWSSNSLPQQRPSLPARLGQSVRVTPAVWVRLAVAPPPLPPSPPALPAQAARRRESPRGELSRRRRRRLGMAAPPHGGRHPRRAFAGPARRWPRAPAASSGQSVCARRAAARRRRLSRPP